MDEYTPTTDKVRHDYAYVLFEFGPTAERLAMFDRWLAQHDAEQQTEIGRLNATIQRVRDVCTTGVNHAGAQLGWNRFRDAILRALEGGEAS